MGQQPQGAPSCPQSFTQVARALKDVREPLSLQEVQPSPRFGAAKVPGPCISGFRKRLVLRVLMAKTPPPARDLCARLDRSMLAAGQTGAGVKDGAAAAASTACRPISTSDLEKPLCKPRALWVAWGASGSAARGTYSRTGISYTQGRGLLPLESQRCAAASS